MEIVPLHPWNLTPAQARELQTRLATRIQLTGTVRNPSSIAGIDVSVSRSSRKGRAAITVLDYSSLKLIDNAIYEGEISFPYIPGLLSFREAPLIIEAWKKLNVRPDVIMMDGQGIAHPRRCGIASHLGLMLDVPTIGCAKSRLIGIAADPAKKAGGITPLVDGDEIIGAVVRTKDGVKPLYISIGHKIAIEHCIEIVLNCCRGYRLPEPVRMAHMAAGATALHYIK